MFYISIFFSLIINLNVDITCYSKKYRAQYENNTSDKRDNTSLNDLIFKTDVIPAPCVCLKQR